MSGSLKIIMEGDSKELEDIIRNVFAKRQMAEYQVRETSEKIDIMHDRARLLEQLAEIQKAKWMTEKDKQWEDMNEIEQRLRELAYKTKLTEAKAKLTIRNSLLALRSAVDALNFLGALTGEHIETHFLSMISMGLSAALQIKFQAALYAATPGAQPLALMMLSLLPALTGIMLWQRAEMLKWTTKIQEQNESDWNSLLGGI